MRAKEGARLIEERLVEVVARREWKVDFEASGVELALGEFIAPGSVGEAEPTPLLLLPSPPPAATIHGMVRDAAGRPAAGIEVGWGPPGHTLENSVHTDAEGAFALADVPPGEVALRAGGGDDGRADERVTLSNAQDFLWSPILERGLEVAGRLVSSDDEKPIAGARVELWSVSARSVGCDATFTNEDGRFALPNVASGPLELRVFPPDAASPFPALVARGVFGGVELGELRLERGAKPTTLALALKNAEDAAIPGSEVRVWQSATGIGALATGPDEEGRFSLAGLAPGAYRIEAGSTLGWRDLGTVWVGAAGVDPTQDDELTLGTERFTRPGIAQLTDESGGRGGLALWSAHADVFGKVLTTEAGQRALVPLRAGEYVVCASGEHGERCEAPFTANAGEVQALAIAHEASGAFAAHAGAVDPAFVSAENARCAACHAPATVGVPMGAESRAAEVRDLIFKAF
jgi:hypothetical protein